MLELPLKVLVADDHSLFRQGLISLMSTRPDLVQVCGEAETGDEALALALDCRPDVALLDIYMPHGDGLQTASALRQRLPDTAIIMLTASELDDHVYRAVQLGAAGYLLKSLDAQELSMLEGGAQRGRPDTGDGGASAARAWPPGRRREPRARATTERELDVRLVAQSANNRRSPRIAHHGQYREGASAQHSRQAQLTTVPGRARVQSDLS